jgi:putative transposase
MAEKERRLEAIRRVAQGEVIPDVCADLNRSRTWYYKWSKRFQSEGASGLVDRRLENSPRNATPDWLKKLIVETRDRLVKQAQNGTSFQGIGAREVVRELEELEVDVPHWMTIHRILKEAGRINPTARPIGYSTSYRRWSELGPSDRHLASRASRRGEVPLLSPSRCG